MTLKFEDLTVEQKIGMVLCARRFEQDDVDYIVHLIKNHSLGCVQLPAENKKYAKQFLMLQTIRFWL